MRIDINDTGLMDIINMFPERENKRSIVNSINKSITNVVTKKAKIAGDKLDIVKTGDKTKAKIIKSHLTKKKANYSTLSGKSKAEGDPLALRYFRHRPSPSGVKVRVLKGGSIKDIKHAFIAEMDSGHIGIFWRENVYGRPVDPNLTYAKLPYKYRHKIKELFGPRIEDILADVYDDLERFGLERLTANLRAEIDSRLRGF